MRIPLYQVDAFTSKTFGGNPAAVCPLSTVSEQTVDRLLADLSLCPRYPRLDRSVSKLSNARTCARARARAEKYRKDRGQPWTAAHLVAFIAVSPFFHTVDRPWPYRGQALETVDSSASVTSPYLPVHGLRPWTPWTPLAVVSLHDVASTRFVIVPRRASESRHCCRRHRAGDTAWLVHARGPDRAETPC